MNILKFAQLRPAKVTAINIAAVLAVTLVCISQSTQGATLTLATAPLFDSVTAPPLNMLVLGRDHKLFMSAYNDASDLNGDGLLDVGYKGYLPNSNGGIDYFGYFDSHECYAYGSGVFTPSYITADKTCNGSTWSGDFLNYITTSRIDALRKVLYGGYRSTDTTSSTVLERAYIPQDAHSWGKEYQSQARDGYDIHKYTPLAQASNSSHYVLFANTTLTSTLTSSNALSPNGDPLMRVMSNTTHRVWEWLSKEAPVAGGECASPGSWSSGACDIAPVDYVVRVQVCNSTMVEANCEQYPNGSYKPVGLLHQYGETNQMYFGLLSGSYVHNFEGGVIRKEVTSFTDELDSNTGIFVSPKKGMIASLDGFKIEDSTSYSATYSHNRNCGNWWDQAQSDGNCRIWGNPVGEMMFESLRYFSGATSPTSTYSYTSSGSDDAALGLPEVTTWKDPYKAAANGGQGYPVCAKPFDTVISDVNTSRDSDLPGSAWNSIAAPSGKLSTLNVSTLGQTIWNAEFGSGSKSIFIGEVGATADGMPTAKTASSFGNIRGLSPEEPTRQGTYYAASVAYFGHINDISSATNNQFLNTYAVALSSPTPRMEIPVGGKTITLVPLGKVVCGPSSVTCASNVSNGSWQPTEQIVAFYIDTMANMPGQSVNSGINSGRPYLKFRINFEDAEQGSDYDMDEIVVYTLWVTDTGKLNVTLQTEYASAGYESHIGYVISGTDTRDGVYLEVSGGGSVNTHYKFDTPSATPKWAGDCVSSPALCALLPGPSSAGTPGAVTAVRAFTPGNNPPATLLKDPLWYAAKFGGFSDDNANKLPDEGEWDANSSGTPDNYFLVTNALTLGTQMATAFDEIIQHTSSASTVAVNSGSISTNSRVYQAVFHSGDWLGHLLSFKVNPDGTLSDTAEWDAADKLPAAASRSIFTTNSNGSATPFTWAGIDSTRQAQLSSVPATAQNRLNYLRGDATNEVSNGGTFRNRAKKLGDIINSAPLFVGAPSDSFSDSMESLPYSTFVSNHINRQGMVYVGANDGMMHAINGDTGVEQFAYIPSPVFGNLKRLTSPTYVHRYFVDGSPSSDDAFIGGQWKTVLLGGLGGGGQGIYALDITDPTAFSTSKVLWEFTDRGSTGDADLGNTFSQPAIAKLHNGKWAAIFGNGYNNTVADGSASTTGHAVLYIVDLSNGSLIQKIDTMAGTSTTPNGLATPTVVDINNDGIADFVYAGDLLGNLWKFDLKSSTATSWSIPYGTASVPVPLYAAKDANGNRQPITSRPEVSFGPGNIGLMVYFGTGKWLEDPADRLDNSTVTVAANQRPQSLYGVYDPNAGPATDPFTGRGNLGQQTILAETTVTSTDGNTITPVRVTSNNAVGTRGWFMDLISPAVGYQGERVVANVILRNNRVIFTTLIPQSDPCAFGGSSWIMELDSLTGSRLTVPPFDLNRDGKIDSNDRVTVTVGGVTITVQASGQQTDVGIAGGLGVLSESGTPNEDKYAAGTSGEIEQVKESGRPLGRQSWRQMK